MAAASHVAHATNPTDCTQNHFEIHDSDNSGTLDLYQMVLALQHGACGHCGLVVGASTGPTDRSPACRLTENKSCVYSRVLVFRRYIRGAVH